MLERLDPNSEHWSSYATDHIARYKHVSASVTAKRVLDAGCGYGYGSAIMKVEGQPVSIDAVDIDESVITEAKVRWKDLHINFKRDDCETLSTCPDNSYDIVVSFENIEHLKNYQGFLSHSYRVLRTDGLLICSTPDKNATPPFVDGIPVNKYHHNEWTKEEFISILQETYDAQDICYYSQVQSYCTLARTTLVNDLTTAVNRLTKLTSFTLSGFAHRLLRGKHHPIRTNPTSLDSYHDFPIVDSTLAKLYGMPWCHYVVCRKK